MVNSHAANSFSEAHARGFISKNSHAKIDEQSEESPPLALQVVQARGMQQRPAAVQAKGKGFSGNKGRGSAAHAASSSMEDSEES